LPRLCGFYPGICLTTKEKARKTLSQGGGGDDNDDDDDDDDAYALKHVGVKQGEKNCKCWLNKCRIE
jgi:hypothetical protein